MSAEEIRARYVDAIARELFAVDADLAGYGPDDFEDWAPRYHRKAEPYVDALEEAGLLAGPVAAYLLAVPLPDGLPPNVITAYARRDLAEATAVKQTELNNCEYRVYEIREVNRG